MADPHAEAVGLNALACAVSQPEALQCCCGQTDCVFLKHNCSVLDSVEKDVHTAARLGQVCRCRNLKSDYACRLWVCILAQMASSLPPYLIQFASRA